MSKDKKYIQELEKAIIDLVIFHNQVNGAIYPMTEERKGELRKIFWNCINKLSDEMGERYIQQFNKGIINAYSCGS